MISRNVDHVLIGHSYLSLILSIELLEKGQKVLLIDDIRLGYGELYTTTLCQIEKNLLYLLGKNKNIPVLQNIEKYISKKPITFIFDNKRIRLGDSTQNNYSELARKLPFLFKKLPEAILNKILPTTPTFVGFNNAYELYCHHLSEKILTHGKNPDFSLKMLLLQCPEEIIEIFNSLKAAIIDEGNVESHWIKKTFIYITRGFYQKKLCSNINDLELFHLMISLLSPQYELNEKQLIIDLLSYYKERGGEFKKTNVSDWRFDKNRPWSLKLSSYEGIIHPKKISILSGIVKDIPLEIRPMPNIYSAIEVEWTFHREFGERWQGERVVSGSSSKMGTGRPLWEASFYQNKVVCRVFIPHEKGSKLDFYKEEIAGILQDDLRSIIIDLPRMFLSESVRFIPEVWVEEYPVGTKGSGNDGPLPLEIKIYDLFTQARLKDVFYFGPYRRAPLGFISSIVALDEAPEYLIS